MSEQTSMKHVKDTTGVIYRIQPDPKNIRTMLVLEWADDGFGNWYWEQNETVHFPFAGIADAMFHNLQECPDPSVKDNEPPFKIGDLVEVTNEGLTNYGETLRIVGIMDHAISGVSYCLEDNDFIWHYGEKLKLINRGGQ